MCKLALMWDTISFSNYLVCPIPIFVFFCVTPNSSTKLSSCSNPPTKSPIEETLHKYGFKGTRESLLQTSVLV